jgi:hypothetical protein
MKQKEKLKHENQEKYITYQKKEKKSIYLYIKEGIEAIS